MGSSKRNGEIGKRYQTHSGPGDTDRVIEHGPLLRVDKVVVFRAKAAPIT